MWLCGRRHLPPRVRPLCGGDAGGVSQAARASVELTRDLSPKGDSVRTPEIDLTWHLLISRDQIIAATATGEFLRRNPHFCRPRRPSRPFVHVKRIACLFFEFERGPVLLLTNFSARLSPEQLTTPLYQASQKSHPSWLVRREHRL
jgi:hypothetical protein